MSSRQVHPPASAAAGSATRVSVRLRQGDARPFAHYVHWNSYFLPFGLTQKNKTVCRPKKIDNI